MQVPHNRFFCRKLLTADPLLFLSNQTLKKNANCVLQHWGGFIVARRLEDQTLQTHSRSKGPANKASPTNEGIDVDLEAFCVSKVRVHSAPVKHDLRDTLLDQLEVLRPADARQNVCDEEHDVFLRTHFFSFFLFWWWLLCRKQTARNFFVCSLFFVWECALLSRSCQSTSDRPKTIHRRIFSSAFAEPRESQQSEDLPQIPTTQKRQSSLNPHQPILAPQEKRMDKTV